MPTEPQILDLPEGVNSVNMKEQKVFDNLSFPLILSPIDPFKDKDARFWNDWVKKNLKAIESLLFKYGAILFREFPIDTPKEFDEFAKAYGYTPFSNVGGSAVRFNVAGNVYTASETPPEYKLHLHHEMAHINDYPYILFFYCDIPAKEGGNTPLALSNVIYRKMTERDPDFVRRLEREGLRYSRVAPNGNDERNTFARSWQSTCFTSNREEAEKNVKALGFDFEWVEDGAMKLTSEILQHSLALSNVIYRKMTERDPDFVRRLEREGLRYSRVAPNGNDERNTFARSWQSTCFTSNREEAEKNVKALGFDFEWVEDGAMKLTSEILPAIRVDKRNGKNIWFNMALSFTIMGQRSDTNKFKAIFPNDDAISNETIEVLNEVMEEAKVSFKWQHRDVIMVDNRAVQHSKDVYPAPPRRILVSYFQDHQGPI